MNDGCCSGQFAKLIAREVSPLEHQEHPGLEKLFDLSSQDVSSETRAELVGHLATCEACRGRWKKLQAHLQDEEAVLRSRVRVPSFAQYIGERSARRRSVPTWTRRLFESKPYMVLAASAATLVLTLGVSIPLLRGPAVRRVAELSGEVQQLRNQIATSPWTENTIANGLGTPSGITAQDLTTLNWQNPRVYVVEAGEGWQEIAQNELGDERLWPLLWLYNREIVPADASPKAGTTIHLPTPYGG
jgi:hypothetical protein